MVAAITATPDALSTPPRVLLQATGFPVGATKLWVTRTDGFNGWAPVRSANSATPVAGAWTGYDYEAPFGEALTYTAVNDATTEMAVGSCAALREYGAQSPWLIHPGLPNLSIPLDGPTISDETRDAAQGVHVVIGRHDPVVVSDGVRHSPTFQLTIKARSKAADDAIRALLDDVTPLLLNYVFPFTDLADYYWVSIAAATRARLTNDYGEPYYLWTLPCTATAAPSGLLQAQRTYGDVLAAFGSYGDVQSTFATYNGLLINTPGA